MSSGSTPRKPHVRRRIIGVADQARRGAGLERAKNVLHRVRVEISEEIERDSELILDQLAPAAHGVRRHALRRPSRMELCRLVKPLATSVLAVPSDSTIRQKSIFFSAKA